MEKVWRIMCYKILIRHCFHSVIHAQLAVLHNLQTGS